MEVKERESNVMRKIEIGFFPPVDVGTWLNLRLFDTIYVCINNLFTKSYH